jgi:hypothetical protein
LPIHRKDFTCGKGSYLEWAGLPLLERNPTVVMGNCHHNVLDSLDRRYLKDTPEPNLQELDMDLINRIINDLVARVRQKIQPFDVNAFMLKKKGRLRKRYLRAYLEILKDGFDLKKHSNIAAFVKLERYFKLGKAPRMILGRNPKFNILYASIIDPIEKAFFELEQVANACDHVGCGAKFEKLIGDWFMENDMTAFEGSQREFILKLEHRFYTKCMEEFKLDDATARKMSLLFAAKIFKDCTSNGVHFKFRNGRGSGDNDTSLGNGFCNYLATQYFMIKNYCPCCKLSRCVEVGCKSYKFVLKGDDSYASIPKVTNYINTYKLFGFDAKIEIRKTPQEVEFCSGNFVEYLPGKYIYAQKLVKLLESLTTCLNPDAIRLGSVGQYYRSLGLMYKKLYQGIPVYDEISDFLLKSSTHGLNINLVSSYNLLQNFSHSKEHNLHIDKPHAIVSIAMNNKMSITELNSIAQWCNSTRLKLPPHLDKRCNIKTPKHEELPHIDPSVLWSHFADNAGRKGEDIMKLAAVLRNYSSRKDLVLSSKPLASYHP